MNTAADQVLDFNAGDAILTEGEPGDFAYLILAGKIEVFRLVDGKKNTLGVLGEGAVVGEMALIDPAPRSASATAVEPGRCRRINRAALERALDSSPPLARHLLQTFIRNIRNLSGVQPATKAAAAAPAEKGKSQPPPIVSERGGLRILDRKAFQPGEVIFKQGASASAAYLIQSGEVELVRDDGKGDVQTLRTLGAGEVFGELALLENSARAASAIAVNGAVCEVVNAASFAQMMSGSPPIVRALMRIYAGLIQSASRRRVQTAPPA